jgi:O-methyltransferase domain/Dimerisation domain
MIENPSIPEPVQGFSPAGQLLHLISGYWVSQAIHVAAELGIADVLGRKGRPIAELAAATGTNADALYRLLRALASVGVFTETARGEFALTSIGALLRSDMPGNLRAFSRFQGEDWHWGSWGAILDCVRSGRPAITERFGAANCFDYLANRPQSARLFNEAMAGYAAQVHAAVAEAYDFTAAKLIIDVGGGHGTLLARILERAAHARGILFDLPDVVAHASAVFAAHAVADRAGAIGGDFFNVVPAGGDAYLLSTVIHDWDDERAIAILHRVGAAMQAHGRVLLVENVIPEGDAPHPGKWIDLEMLLIAGGRERTEREYARLVEAAGLRMTRVIPTAVSVSIVEAVRG